MIKKTFTANEVMVLVEDLHSQFRVFGEGLMGLNEKINYLTQRFDKLSETVDGITMMVAKNSEDITMIKLDIADIKQELARKANRHEFL